MIDGAHGFAHSGGIGNVNLPQWEARLVRRLDVKASDISPRLSQRACRGEADAAGRARDDGYLATEAATRHHASTS